MVKVTWLNEGKIEHVSSIMVKYKGAVDELWIESDIVLATTEKQWIKGIIESIYDSSDVPTVRINGVAYNVNDFRK